MQNFATFARSKCRKASGLIVQVIRAFLDADPSAAIELLKRHASLWPKLKSVYPTMRDFIGFTQLAQDGNENQLMYLEQRRHQWHPSPEMRRRFNEGLTAKSVETMKRSLQDLDGLFEEHGATVLVHFDRHFARF